MPVDPVKILKTGIAESEEDPFYVVKSEARRPWRPVPNPTADWTNRRERGAERPENGLRKPLTAF